LERGLPYSDWCYVCGEDNPIGFRIVLSTEDGRVRIRYKPEVQRQGYIGVVHGGVLSTLLDEAMAWAPTVHTGRMCVTAELTVRFLQPFPLEKMMIVEAWADKVTRRLSLVQGEVKDEEGTVYATARGKFLPMSQEETREVGEMLIYDPDTLKVFEASKEDEPK
jgi:uncharacterized protein (TIGR00369 family)